MSQLPDGLSPLEAALVETLQAMHHDVIKELRIFRWQTIALVVFLIAIVALLKGVDPRVAATAATEVMAPVPAMVMPEAAPVVHDPSASGEIGL